VIKNHRKMKKQEYIMYYNNFGERRLSMLMDFYELTMANGYFSNGMKDEIVYFDLFFRKKS